MTVAVTKFKRGYAAIILARTVLFFYSEVLFSICHILSTIQCRAKAVRPILFLVLG